MYLDLHAHNSQYQIDLDSLLDFLNKELIKKQSHYEADHRALWNARGVVGGKLPHAMTDRFNRVYIADKALSELDNFDLRCWIREASILIRAENQSSLQGALEAVCIKYSKQLEFNLSGFERVFKTYSSNYQEAKKLYQQIKTLKDKIQEASLDINSLLKLEDQDTKEFELEACRKMRTSLETERGALVKKYKVIEKKIVASSSIIPNIQASVQRLNKRLGNLSKIPENVIHQILYGSEGYYQRYLRESPAYNPNLVNQNHSSEGMQTKPAEILSMSEPGPAYAFAQPTQEPKPDSNCQETKTESSPRTQAFGENSNTTFYAPKSVASAAGLLTDDDPEIDENNSPSA